MKPGKNFHFLIDSYLHHFFFFKDLTAVDHFFLIALPVLISSYTMVNNTNNTKKPKKIINDPASAVEEFIQGILLQYPNRLAKLANHNVVLKADLKSSSSSSHRQHQQVHLLSGGGSGHEPSHAGWIGHGMLSGAICGGIFASPSVAAILSAIRAAAKNNDMGVLLVVKNVSTKNAF
jgi:Dak1 domain